MDARAFCSASRVVVVAGKGGVGKTTVTAALAVMAARAGLSVLVVEVEGKSGLASAFGKPELGYHEIELHPGITARFLTPDEALVEYLEDHGLSRISRRLARTGALEVVATAVPGMKDILLLGKVKQLEQDGTADLVIIDAPAAGHAVSFLLSPQGLLDAVHAGPIRKQAAEVVEMLHDPARCRVLLVTVPEETPVNELVETAYAIEDRAGVSLGPVLVNGCYPETDLPTSPAEIQELAAAADVFVSDREADDLAAAAAFRSRRGAIQAAQIERLADRLPLPQIRLPFVFAAGLRTADVELLADALEAGVGNLTPVPG